MLLATTVALFCRFHRACDLAVAFLQMVLPWLQPATALTSLVARRLSVWALKISIILFIKYYL